MKEAASCSDKTAVVCTQVKLDFEELDHWHLNWDHCFLRRRSAKRESELPAGKPQRIMQ